MMTFPHKPWLAFFVSSLLSLSACSSGGGDNSTTQPQTKTHNITTVSGPNGSIAPDTLSVSNGESAIFTLFPDKGYAIESVTGCSGTLSGTIYTTGTITNSCTVSASFIPESYSITTTSSTGGTINPVSQAVAYGDVINFEVSPDSGYSITSISGCNGTLSDTTYTTAPATTSCMVSATFAQGTPLPLYNVTVSAEPTVGGSVSGGGSYSDGIPVTVSAISEPGFSFTNWTEDGVSISISPHYNFTTTTERQLVANFAVDVYTVSTTVSVGGSITPTDRAMGYGESTTFTLVPNDGYSIQSITGCNGTLAGNTYTTGAITGDCEVTVIFARFPLLKFNEGLLDQSSLG